jgi:CRISPR-associated endoribonuclease cas2
VFVIVVYDFGEKRVAKALKICRKYLTWVQNSVFEGKITEGNFKKLQKELEMKMDKMEDTLILYSFQSTKYSKRDVIGCEKNKPTVFL